jgi:23S rRNA pseudouridine1911/1915/1917 synthase
MDTAAYLSRKVPESMAGVRLDKALAELFPAYSRSRLQQWIVAGQVLVNQAPLRAKDKLNGGEEVQVTVQLEEAVEWQAQPLPLTLLYEDEDILVVNKPAGLVVHPGAGNPDNTLVNALLHHAPELAQLPRAGIVHRLDKDTSGVLVIARSLTAHTQLINQQQAREFEREYQAIVQGVLISGGTINAPIGRHPTQRVQMAVVEKGKPAVTHYRIIQRYRAHTHLRLKLETGRTHQIRVHLAHQRHAVVGDPMYGGKPFLPPHPTTELIEVLSHFTRQALHAERLGLVHPRTGEFMEWMSAVPMDMQILLETLDRDRQQYA